MKLCSGKPVRSPAYSAVGGSLGFSVVWDLPCKAVVIHMLDWAAIPVCDVGNGMSEITLPKTNMDPDDGPLEECLPLPTSGF